jgi:hypothetical protein
MSPLDRNTILIIILSLFALIPASSGIIMLHGNAWRAIYKHFTGGTARG